jgi:hypothetical protein
LRLIVRAAARRAGVPWAVAILCLCSASASAQTLLTGAIAGEVRREAGGALGGVTVTLRSSPAGAVLGMARSSQDGLFSFPILEPGSYEASFEQLGYQPLIVENIVVQPGAAAALRVVLPAVEGQLDRVEVQRRTAEGGASTTAAQRWLLGPVPALPFGTDDLSTLSVLSSRAGERRDFEGLPARFDVYSVDGLPRAERTALAQRLSAASIRNPFLSFAELIADPVDVERPAGLGGLFAGITRLGTGGTSGHVYGDWSGDALGASDAAPAQSYRAGAEIGGAFADSARYLIQAEFAREEQPLGSSFAAGDLSALADAVEQRDGDLSPWTAAHAVRSDRANVSAAVGLPIGAANRLRAHATFLAAPQLDAVDLRTGQPIILNGGADARELFAGGTLSSRLGDGAINELTVGFESGRFAREDAIDLPLTQLVSSGVIFGSDDLPSSEESVRQLYLRETIHLPFGAHRLKVGAWVSHRSYDVDPTQDLAPRLAFTTADDLDGGGGWFTQLRGTAQPASFSLLHAAAYMQDDWVPRPTVRLTAGARLNVMTFPGSGEVRPNVEFFEATGVDSRTMPGTSVTLEPRLAAAWTPAGGNWLLQGSAYVTHAAAWPDAIAEVLSNDGALDQHVALGTDVTWPSAAVPAGAVNTGESLSLLGPEYSGPRTTRVGAGIRRTIGALAIGIEGAYRQTDFLPQRRDLNLLPAAGEDQHGRPLFGPLAKIGGIVGAQPGENRRFGGFAQVYALEATGTSRYTGITLSLERFAADVGLLARYTYSRAEDDWLGGLSPDPGAQLSPFPNETNGDDWADDRSDFDVPHRLALGAQVKVPGRYGPSIAALYRRESGAPFTPGFHAGVDVNADGSSSNDPAYIEPGVDGMGALLGDWSCLADDAGGFARRNGCRGDDVQALDARVSIGIAESDRFAAHLVIDALDLLSSERIVTDRAVYLIDPDAPLARSADGMTTTLPLVANPNFGEPLLRYAPQRRIRLGLRLRY